MMRHSGSEADRSRKMSSMMSLVLPAAGVLPGGEFDHLQACLPEPDARCVGRPCALAVDLPGPVRPLCTHRRATPP